MNTIGADTVRMMRDSLKEVEEKFEGLVIGNQSENFCGRGQPDAHAL